jgi:hypothetical protein
MPIEWNGADIHQSMAEVSAVAVVELTVMLLFCAAVLPEAVY